MDEKSIHTLLNANFKKVLLERVENAANTGTGDCNAVHNGIEWWMEYKRVGAKSKTTTVLVPCSLGKIWLRPAQYAWHVNRAQHGSRAFVVARTDESIVVMQCQKDGSWLELFVTSKPFNYHMLLSAFVTGF
jgi:hypothetical protein